MGHPAIGVPTTGAPLGGFRVRRGARISCAALRSVRFWPMHLSVSRLPIFHIGALDQRCAHSVRVVVRLRCHPSSKSSRQCVAAIGRACNHHGVCFDIGRASQLRGICERTQLVSSSMKSSGRHSDSVRCRQLRNLERDNPVSRSMPRFARAKRSATCTESETPGYPF